MNYILLIFSVIGGLVIGGLVVFLVNRYLLATRSKTILEEAEKEAIQGMDLSKDEMSGYFYPVVVDHPWIRHRVVDRKMVFLPIGKYEIRKVDGLDQNPGWGD